MNFQKAVDRQMEFLQSHLGKRLHTGLFDPSKVALPFPQAPTFLSRPLPEVVELIGYTDPRSIERRSIRNYGELMENLRTKIWSILLALQGEEKFSEVFQKPVTEVIAPGYFQTITKPMDFQTMERRLTRFTDYYKRPEMFWADMQQMVENCKTFNPQDTTYYRTAVSLWNKFNRLYSEAFGDWMALRDH
jgi:histone acetyltransferase